MCFIHLEWRILLKTIKRVIAMLLCVMMIMSAFACRKDTDNSTVKITLSEVAHSIFYAPQYVSIELGYFEDESIDLNLVTGFGADKVMTALVSKEADIGFMGSESSIYVYQEGSTDYAVNFAQLTHCFPAWQEAHRSLCGYRYRSESPFPSAQCGPTDAR